MAIEAVEDRELEAADWRENCTFTLVMRSAYGSAVAIVPGFPTREAALRAARIAEGHPNVDEWGEERDSEVISAAAHHQQRWLDTVILPVPR